MAFGSKFDFVFSGGESVQRADFLQIRHLYTSKARLSTVRFCVWLGEIIFIGINNPRYQ